MFDRLDFIYQPSRDAAADLSYCLSVLGAQLLFAVERFDTRVAGVRLAPHSPALLLAEHLFGEQSILVFRVPDLQNAEAVVRQNDGQLGQSFEMPYGIGRQLGTPAGQRLAMYQPTHLDRGRSIEGRRDF